MADEEIKFDLEKDLLSTAISEFVGDKKKEFKEMVDKISGGIKDDEYYFVYRKEGKLHLVSSKKDNVNIDIKDPKGATVTDLSVYEDLVKNI